MLRSAVLFIFIFGFLSCVSKGKLIQERVSFQASAALLHDSLAMVRGKADSLDRLLLKAQGGNEQLLLAQQQLQDRLLSLDNAKGNLTDTQAKLNGRLRKTEKEKEMWRDSVAALRADFRAVITEFSDHFRVAMDTLRKDSVFTSMAEARLKSGNLLIEINEDQLFPSGASDRLISDRHALLQPIVDILQRYPLFDLQIIGHTDNQEPGRRQPSNLVFASLRAATLAEELTKTYYVSSSRVTASSQGSSSPRKSNATEEGRRANRRIEFRISNSLNNLLRKLESMSEASR